MQEPDTKLGVTLYNLREYCKTKSDLDATLKRVAGIGYRAVQVSAIGPIDPPDIRELLEKHGLYCCATHESMDRYTKEFDRVVEKLETIGCIFTALGFPGNTYFNRKGAAKLPGELEEIGRKFRANGIIFGYHNHDPEFEKFSDKVLLREIYDNTSPEHLSAELDTYWIQAGGGNPGRWIRDMKGRIHVAHLKDYALLDGKKHECEVGWGNLDWDDILAACSESGVRWYVVEQDNPFGDRDIFDSIAMSFEYLRSKGIE